MQPLAIDLYCGLGGWTEGLLAEGYRVIGFDLEPHAYGSARYPAQLVLQDVLTLHGRQFKDAALIVASPPCQAYSYRAMPWKRAKALPPPDNALFEACFRIQREACEASGRYIPLVVENVCGAQKWVGRARWRFGSFYLWGDVPALMPLATRIANVGGIDFNDFKNGKGPSKAFNDVRHAAYAGVKVASRSTHPKGGWFYDNDERNALRRGNSKSSARKAASAHIAKIPYELARHIARAWKPDTSIALRAC